MGKVMQIIWNEQESKKLEYLYNRISNEELLKEFPGRTYLSIYKKARRLGLKKDPEIKFLNQSNARKREKCCNWNGGRTKTNKGYIQILKPEHPRADSRGYVMEHIVIFEAETGINVPENCVVHHLNGNKQDNRIENLCLMQFGAHSTYHNRKRSEKKK